MKKIILSWLNSAFTPLVCLMIVLIENKFTYEIPGAWLLRVFELIICTIGLIAAVRNYSSWFRAIIVFFLAAGILSIAVDIPRNIGESRSSTDNKDSDYVDYSRSTGGSSANTPNYYGYYDPGYNTGWSTPETYSDSKVVCHVCNGSKSCKECHGTGRITIQKQGINLGSGSTTYNEYKRCPLCDGDRKCYWCRGTGYEPFS